MPLRSFSFDAAQLAAAARGALRPRLLITMAAALVGAVVLFGVFAAGGNDLSAVFLRFVGSVAALFCLLFGLTAVAHQIHQTLLGEETPKPYAAACFAWRRASSLIMLPLWGVGLLLALLLAELLLLALSHLPGLGPVLLALIAVPLLLLNTVAAAAVLLALFNIAGRVALGDEDAATVRDTSWKLLKERWAELLLYNLGGVLATCLLAAVVLSPLWLGVMITRGLAEYAAADALQAVIAGGGFWGGIAHLIGLIALGALLAAVVSVPLIIIMHLTLSIHLQLDQARRSVQESEPSGSDPEARSSKEASDKDDAAGPDASPDASAE